VAAAFTTFLGGWANSAVILAVMITNAVIGFIQEGPAERALAPIREMASRAEVSSIPC
jgi:magnesium-transporting ATPase (P-type)